MDGLLIIDKPKDMTSHDVVDFIRRKFSVKKCGHAGTLDPMATGVLVMLVGKYTKFAGRFLEEDKEYEATMVLGAVSDTGDAYGKIEPCLKKTDITKEEADNVFKKFLGPIEQTPPMYSAVKIKGRKLYELARKGLSAEVSPKKITIKDMRITRFSPPEIDFTVTCSKGTYIRKLADDIGALLGCGAYLSGLRRTRSGKFCIDEAITVSDLDQFRVSDLEKRLKSI